MNRWAWLFGLLLLGPTAGCVWEGNSGSDEEITVSAYADFEEGSEWTYDEVHGDNSTTITDAGVQVIDGRSVRVLEVEGEDSLYFDDDLSDRLNLVGTSQDGGTFYEDSLPLLRDEFETGKRYGPYTTDDDDCDVYVTYGREDLSYIDDDYDRTVRTTVTTYCDGDVTGDVQKFWFAKDAGLVKWLDTDGVTWELDHRSHAPAKESP